jgi:hypothetical protein
MMPARMPPALSLEPRAAAWVVAVVVGAVAVVVVLVVVVVAATAVVAVVVATTSARSPWLRAAVAARAANLPLSPTSSGVP